MTTVTLVDLGYGNLGSIETSLRRLGAEHDLPEFVAAGWFLEQYLQNLDDQSATGGGCPASRTTAMSREIVIMHAVVNSLLS